MAHNISADLLSVLACPRDHAPLRRQGDHLCCTEGHQYPIIEGVPVFLLPEIGQTIEIASTSLRLDPKRDGPLYLDTLGISEQEKRGIEYHWPSAGPDPVISYLIGATSGWGYVELIGKLNAYPIPDIPIGDGSGEHLLDVGCNWGRWSVSAARKGWNVIGIDPSFGALMAGKRAFGTDLTNLSFVCADARFLPFKPGVFSCVFSYSVLQHFSEEDTAKAAAEFGRVLRENGISTIQMAHRGGLRSTYIRTRPNYMHGGVFRVRYWSLDDLRRTFENRVGPTTILAEAFGGLGLLPEDKHVVSRTAQVLITASSALRWLARYVTPLVRVADSVYVVSRRTFGPTALY